MDHDADMRCFLTWKQKLPSLLRMVDGGMSPRIAQRLLETHPMDIREVGIVAKKVHKTLKRLGVVTLEHRVHSLRREGEPHLFEVGLDWYRIEVPMPGYLHTPLAIAATYSAIHQYNAKCMNYMVEHERGWEKTVLLRNGWRTFVPWLYAQHEDGKRSQPVFGPLYEQMSEHQDATDIFIDIYRRQGIETAVDVALELSTDDALLLAYEGIIAGREFIPESRVVRFSR